MLVPDLDRRERQRTACQMVLPNLVNCIKFADVGMELLEAHHVLKRRAGGFTEPLDVADDDVRLCWDCALWIFSGSPLNLFAFVT